VIIGEFLFSFKGNWKKNLYFVEKLYG